MAENISIDVIVNAVSRGVPQAAAGMNQLAGAATRVNAATQTQARLGRPIMSLWQGQSKAAGSVATSLGQASQAQDNFNAVTARYAQYDMAGTLLTVAGAITAVGAATAVAFAQQERAFTEVERILGIDPDVDVSAITNLRKELLALTEEVPVAFSELSEIASFGAALDIPAQELDEFSGTVARFIAITDVSAEQAGKSLARIYQYTRSDDIYRGSEAYEQIGSAILRLGNISIATEAEVLSFSQSLAPLGAQFGVGAAQVTAMATATASFANINVEGAGSAFSRVFTIIERNAKGGADNLQAFADMAGVSAERFASMWEEDAGGAFNKVIEGLSNDIPNLVSNLDALGIRNERDKRVVRALAVQYDSYARYLDAANTTLEEGTALGDAYAYVADDLASKWQVFLNVIQNTGAAIGASFAPAMQSALTFATDLLQTLGDFASSPFGGFLVQTTGVILAAVAAWAAYRGAVALATAGSLAFKVATEVMGGPGLARGAQFLAAQITGVGTAATAATPKVAALGATAAAAGGAGGAGRLRTGLAGVISFLGGRWGLGIAAGAAVAGSFFSYLETKAKAARDSVIKSLGEVKDEMEASLSVVRGTEESNILINFSGDSVRRQADSLAGVLGNLQQAMKATYQSSDGLALSSSGLTRELGLTESQSRSVISNLGTLTSAFNDLESQPGQMATGLFDLAEQFEWTTRESLAFTSLLSGDARSSLADYGRSIGLTGNEQAILTQLFQQSDTAARAAADGLSITEAEMEATAEAAEAAKEEVDELLKSLEDFGTATGGVQANLDALWNEIYDTSEATDAFREAGGSLADLMEGGMNPASRELREVFRSINDQTLKSAAGILEVGGSMEDAQTAFRDGRQAIVDMLVELGSGPDEAEAWANAMYGSFSGISDLIASTGEAIVDMNDGFEPVVVKFDAETGEFYNKATGVRIEKEDLDKGKVVPKVGADTDEFDTKAKNTENKAVEMDGRIIKPTMSATDEAFGRIYNVVDQSLDTLQKRIVKPRLDADKSRLDGAVTSAQGRLIALQSIQTVASIGGNTAPLDAAIATARAKLAALQAVATVVNIGASIGFASGGFTGRGSTYQEAGVVHKGEYVIPKHMVNQSTGLPYADALGKLVKGSEGSSYARGGYVNPSVSFPASMALTPGTIQMIAQAVRTEVYLDRKDIARAANRGNETFSQIGAY